MRTKHLIAALAATGLMSGCVESTLEVPKTPNPVLLSRVDRIGGHVADPHEQSVGTVSGKTEILATASKDKSGTTTTTSSATTAGLFIKDVLEKTDGQDERTVHIQKIVAHATFLNLGTYAQLEQSITVAGDVVSPTSPAPSSPAPAASTIQSKTEVAHVSR